MLKARPRMSELLRIVPGSSVSSRRPIATSRARDGSRSGGGLSARVGTAHGSVPRCCRCVGYVSSALDGRESAFELHANGGLPELRGRLRRGFEGYNELGQWRAAPTERGYAGDRP